MTALPRSAAPHALAKIDWLAAGGLFVCSFVVYLQTLRRSFGWGDSSELTTAAYHLGIGHSPGYPTYMLIGYVFSHLPFGTVALRMNLMSAFFGSVAVALSYFVFRYLTRSRLGAFLGAITFAFTATLWDLTTEAEVYTLHATFVAAIVLLLFRWGETGKPHPGWIGLLTGLSLGNHALTLLLLPGIFFFAAAKRGMRFLVSKPMALALAGFALGFCVYGYLLIRGPANPPPGVNDPQNLKEFFIHLTSPGSREVMFDSSLLRVLGRLWLYGPRLKLEVAWAGIILGLVGLALLWRRDRKVLGLLALLFAANVFYAANYSIFDIYCYFVTSYWVWCGFIAVGGEAAVGWGQRLLEKVQGREENLGPRGRRLLVGSVALLLPFWLATGHWKKVDVSEDRGPEEFARAALGMVDKDALILGDWWAIAPLGYLKHIEGVRPDVMLCPAFSLSSKKAIERHQGRKFLAQFPAVYATEMLTYGMNELRKRYILIPQGPLERVFINGPEPALAASDRQGEPQFLFGDDLALIGWEVQPESVQTPGMLAVNLYWRSLQPRQTGEQYDVMVALGRDGRDWIWREKTPLAHGLFPMEDWRPGRTLVEKHRAFLTSEIETGKYRLSVSLRHRSGDNRLMPVSDAAEQQRGKAAYLGEVTIETRPK